MYADILSAMRRLIAIFLLVLLPFQAVWAAMEPYCLHENAQSQSHHFGHHEHQHHADTDVAQHDDDTKNTGTTHNFRVYPAKATDGVVAPNTYVLALDFGLEGSFGKNHDFQDTVYIIKNVVPTS